MNKQFVLRKLSAALMLTAGFVCAPVAQAALEDLGNGIIKDIDLGIVWLADANYSKTSGYNTTGVMTWNGANNWADQLDVGGYDWRLPTTSEFEHLFDELGGVTGYSINNVHTNAPFALFSNIQVQGGAPSIQYWTSTPTHDADIHSLFRFDGWSSTANKNSGFFATAVATIPAAAPIPEPETYAMLLAGLGLVGFVARRGKRSRKAMASR